MEDEDDAYANSVEAECEPEPMEGDIYAGTAPSDDGEDDDKAMTDDEAIDAYADRLEAESELF